MQGNYRSFTCILNLVACLVTRPFVFHYTTFTKYKCSNIMISKNTCSCAFDTLKLNAKCKKL